MLLLCFSVASPADPPDVPLAVTGTPGIWVTDDGFPLPYRRWGPEDPERVLLVLHGLNDYSGGMEELGVGLAQRGIATYAYDQRGFGMARFDDRWAGTETLIDDADWVGRRLAEAYSDGRVFLAGHSMGGALAMVLEADRRSSWYEGIVLLAPAVWGREAMPWYQRSALWLGSRLMPGVEFTGEVVGVDPSDNAEAVRRWMEDPLTEHAVRGDTLRHITNLMDRALQAPPRLQAPVLFLYGLHDEVIPPEPTCMALRRFPPGTYQHRFVIYPQGYHMLTRDLQRDRVHEDIAAWLRDPDRDILPSFLERSRKAATRRVCEHA